MLKAYYGQWKDCIANNLAQRGSASDIVHTHGEQVVRAFRELWFFLQGFDEGQNPAALHDANQKAKATAATALKEAQKEHHKAIASAMQRNLHKPQYRQQPQWPENQVKMIRPPRNLKNENHPTAHSI